MKRLLIPFLTAIFLATGPSQAVHAEEAVTMAEFKDSLIQYDNAYENDYDTKIVGSDGILHDNVAYLSAGTVERLDEENKNLYQNACEEVIENINDGFNFVAVMSVDENGEVTFTRTFSMEDKTENETTNEFIQIKTKATKKPSKSSASDDTIAENEELREAIEIKEETIEINNSDNPGEMIEFDNLQVDRDYFIHQLSENGQHACNLLVKAAGRGYNSIYIQNGWTAWNIYEGITGAWIIYPKLFDWTAYKYSIVTNTFMPYITIEKSPYWSPELEEAANQKEIEIAEKAKAYAEKYTPNDITYGIIEYVDNWICANTYYSYDDAYHPVEGSELFFYCHSSYGALLKGVTVCESSSKAVTRILDRAGIRNVYVRGNAPGPHSWNHIYINGKWYMLDLTINDRNSDRTDRHTSNKELFLTGSDTIRRLNYSHTANGQVLTNGPTLTFEPLSETDYRADVENLGSYNKTVKRKKSVKIKSGMNITEWVSEDPTIASIKKKSRNKAKCVVKGKNRGTTTIIGLQNGYPVIAYRITVR